LSPVYHVAKALNLQSQLAQQMIQARVLVKLYRIDEAKVVEVKLVGAGEKCSVVELRAYAGAPLIKINLPIINEFAIGIYPWATIEKIVDRPRNILCETVHDFLLS
jgi:hypothetical protein